MQFSEFFDQATNGCSPYPYQQEFAESEHLPEVLIAPTGSGKEFTIILGWLYRLLYSQLPTPRRLVYCLPMRTLVEQVYKNTSKIFESLGLTQQVGLFKLMGGVIENDWDANPLRPTILIGTQDQLQSRALHRGYAMNRYRWTVHFALLNDDCLWVFDETQLMGAGLATSAQLQGLRDVLKTYNRVHSLWMSATLDTQPLKTVNHPKELEVLTLSEKDRQHEKLAQRLNAKKRLAKLDIKPDKDGKNLAKAILEHHTSNSLTLVVLNQVARAQAVYRALKKQTQEKLLLVHSRFREADRNRITEDLEHFKGIVIATQAIEAGVNLSAKLLITELAPWSSIIQRAGRCNREGGIPDALVLWVEVGTDKKASAPYTPEELKTTRTLLAQLDNLDIPTIENFSVQQVQRESAIPRRTDLLDLFDTTPDLNGNDVDISLYIRDSEDTDIFIGWRTWDGSKDGQSPPSDLPRLQRQELCRVRINHEKIRGYLKPAWCWDGRLRTWVKPNTIYPGLTLLLPCSAGGYDSDLGFTGEDKHIPTEVELPTSQRPNDADDADYDAEAKQWVTLRQHSEDVAKEVTKLCQALIPNESAEPIIRAGRWHDYGKAHHVWQAAASEGNSDTFWAKAPKLQRFKRPGFRHELVSALAALQAKEDFLVCYLIACHHGKVRLRIEPRPTENPPSEPPYDRRYALGVWDNDPITQEVDLGDGLIVPKQKLSLECMELGESSWTNQALALLEQYGPFKLALLEAIVRIADWQSSQKYQ